MRVESRSGDRPHREPRIIMPQVGGEHRADRRAAMRNEQDESAPDRGEPHHAHKAAGFEATFFPAQPAFFLRAGAQA